MKLPSGREINTESLSDATEIFAMEAFHLDDFEEGEHNLADILQDECFSLSSREAPFDKVDTEAILKAIRHIAHEVYEKLLKSLSKCRKYIEKEMNSETTKRP